MKKLEGGVMPACMTIWNADETLNVKGQEKYLTWLIDNGATSLSVCGSTGENMAMSIAEQKQVIEVTCKYVAGQVPVYAGTGRYSTMHTIELTKFAQECGADGAMVILPYYFTPHKRSVMEHFRKIRATLNDDFDIMIYNNPWFAGYELNANEIKTLVDEGVIGAVKAAHGDTNRVHDLKLTCGDTLTVMYGHDYNPMEALLGGADGWLSGLPAVFPKYCRALYEACALEKNVDKGRTLWARMKPFMDYFYTYKTNDPHWLEIFKYVLRYQLDFAGTPRLPLGDVSPEEKQKLDIILKGLSDLL